LEDRITRIAATVLSLARGIFMTACAREKAKQVINGPS